MKFTKEELNSVVRWLIGGGIVGGLFSVGSLVLNKRLDIEELNPKTEHLPYANNLYYLFKQLAYFREFDEVSFVNAVNEADRLALLWREIKNGNIKVSENDCTRAFYRYETCKKNLNRMFIQIKKSQNAKKIVQFQNVFQKIVPYLADLKSFVFNENAKI